MARFTLLLLFWISCYHSSYGQFLIEGKVKADSSWSPVVYLSMIPRLEEMQTVSPDMIAMQAEVDAAGRFTFKGEYLPEGDRLYRLHLSKKGDPPSTIIIGGKDENHFFLIANSNIDCSFSAESDSSLWGQVTMKNCYINYRLQEIDGILEEYDADASRDFSLGREFLKIARDEKLRSYADTCQFLLPALYALHFTHLQSHSYEDPQYYIRFLNKWKHLKSPYLEEFHRDIGYLIEVEPEPDHAYWIIVLICLLLGFGIYPLFQSLSRKSKDSSQSLLKQLSLQERKIFLLIRDGKSNKEISEQLHIEPTTVKSHVRNVYGKLKINSRKDALNFPFK